MAYLLLAGLSTPLVLSVHTIVSFDFAVANPPFSSKSWSNGLDPANDEYDRFSDGIPPKKNGDYAFLLHILRSLKLGGRAAVIVPDGVLFGSSRAHKTLRRMLVEEQKLDGIVSMPSGVFRPYAGVSTAILLFTKTDSGGTDDVWFYDMQADGYSLDDKRNPLDAGKHETNNLPDILARWNNRDAEQDRDPK